jgi:hypothetical protein
LTTLSGAASDGYLLAYGCGGGTFTGAGGIATTADFAAGPQRAVFTLLFGSYFGDWDSSDNFLRAALASSPYVLTSGWAGRPHWHLHHMGLGETIGFSARATQNNSGLYVYNYAARGVHIALMGDPTLRLHVVAPAKDLSVRSNPAGGLRLSWTASTDAVAGYHIYRATTASSLFVRLTQNFIATNEYVDLNGAAQIYMVRAIKEEVTPSGSYFNPSQGIFQDAAGSFGPASLAIAPAGNGVVVVSWPSRLLGYHLEAATSLSAKDWSALNVPLTTNSSRIAASIPVPAGSTYRYFRLRE